MQVLWLRYLTEINEKTREVPGELLENPEINKAVTQLEESAFSEAQLLGYDRFWDMVSTAKMQISSSRREAMEKGRAEGKQAERLKNAGNLKRLGVATEIIAQATGLTAEEIEQL